MHEPNDAGPEDALIAGVPAVWLRLAEILNVPLGTDVRIVQAAVLRHFGLQWNAEPSSLSLPIHLQTALAGAADDLLQVPSPSIKIAIF